MKIQKLLFISAFSILSMTPAMASVPLEISMDEPQEREYQGHNLFGVIGLSRVGKTWQKDYSFQEDGAAMIQPGTYRIECYYANGVHPALKSHTKEYAFKEYSKYKLKLSPSAGSLNGNDCELEITETLFTLNEQNVTFNEKLDVFKKAWQEGDEINKRLAILADNADLTGQQKDELLIGLKPVLESIAAVNQQFDALLLSMTPKQGQ